MSRAHYSVPGLLLLVALTSCSEPITEPDQVPAADQITAEDPALSTAATALSFYQVSGGEHHTCGITNDNRAYCWGNGILGDGQPTRHSTTPVAVAGGLSFMQVSAAGFEHMCGVTTDYRAYCWGVGSSGQLGDGTNTDRLTPVPVAGGLRFYHVDGGGRHTCGLSYPDKKAYCWGGNDYGELGDGEQFNQRSAPFAVLGGHQFRQVSVGIMHSCGLTTAGPAYCWGSNYFGEIGAGDDASNETHPTPTLVAGGRHYIQLDAGAIHACAVTTDHRAYCWGGGGSGQIGDGRTYLRFAPRAVAGGLSFDRVTAGWEHTCGEASGNRAYCWGSNSSGQLGDGTTTRRLTPVAVAGGLFFSQVSSGRDFSCGRNDTGVGYCWGYNVYGQLGDGTTTNRLTPTPIAGPAS